VSVELPRLEGLREPDKYERLVERDPEVWWSDRGPFLGLHELNLARVEYFRGVFGGFAGKRVLDVGCGGGILAEALAREGARVTGVDPSEKSIDAARRHAVEPKSSLDERREAGVRFVGHHMVRADDRRGKSGEKSQPRANLHHHVFRLQRRLKSGHFSPLVVAMVEGIAKVQGHRTVQGHTNAFNRRIGPCDAAQFPPRVAKSIPRAGEPRLHRRAGAHPRRRSPLRVASRLTVELSKITILMPLRGGSYPPLYRTWRFSFK